MVDVTIRADLEGEGPQTMKMRPCGMAFLVGISQKGRGVESQVGLIGGKGLKKGEAINALADGAVDVLVEFSEGSEKSQARVLAVYIKSFIDAAGKKTGETVMVDLAGLFGKMIKIKEGE